MSIENRVLITRLIIDIIYAVFAYKVSAWTFCNLNRTHALMVTAIIVAISIIYIRRQAVWLIKGIISTKN